MWNRQEIKLTGKAAFKSNYWRSVLCALILTVLMGGTALKTGSNGTESEDASQQATEDLTNAVNSLTEDQKAALGLGILAASTLVFLIAFLLKVFVFNPLQVGCYAFFRDNVEYGGVTLQELGSGFRNYGRTFVTLLLRDVFLILWFFLFIIPAFIKLYSYRMVPFIIRDNPELSATEVITRSRQMMDGHKWNTFVFDLSYIGWYILGMFTFGLVNVFWTEPYRQNANAALYLELSQPGFTDLDPSMYTAMKVE